MTGASMLVEVGHARAAVAVGLILIACVLFSLAFIIGDQGADSDHGWIGALVAAWLVGGAGVAVVSIGATLWYAVGTTGFALIFAVSRGLALLVDLAEEWPEAAGVVGAAIGVVLMAAAAVSAATGHPRLALGALVGATFATGMTALALVEEWAAGENTETNPRHAMIVAIVGCAVTAMCGVTLAVIGFVMALHGSGPVPGRLLGGGTVILFGGGGLWLAGAVLVVHLRSDKRLR